MKFKNIFSIFAVLFMFLLLSGTAMASIEINDVTEFSMIGSTGYSGAYPLDGDYVLTENLDFWGFPFTPIGTQANPFNGTINGKGHTISNISISGFGKNSGIFRVVNDSTIQNLIIENASISNTGEFTGVLAGHMDFCTVDSVTFINCSVSGENRSGILAGRVSNSSIFSVHVTNDDSLKVEGVRGVGGLIGRAETVSIADSSVKANIFGKDHNVGGFVGNFLDESVVLNCSFVGEVSGISGVGGFAGRISDSEIKGSYAEGSVSGTDDNVGGFVGNLVDASILQTNYFKGSSVSGNDNVGGFAGRIVNSTISQCFSKGLSDVDLEIVGNSRIGGFVGIIGVNADDSSIVNSYTSGSVDGMTRLGNFVGFVASGGNPDIVSSYSYICDFSSEFSLPFVGEIHRSANIEVTDSFYCFDGAFPDAFGIPVIETDLKKLSTFMTTGGFVADDWDMDSSGTSNTIWYINNGNDFPILRYEGVPKIGGGGSGFGHAVIVDSSSPTTPVHEESKTPESDKSDSSESSPAETPSTFDDSPDKSPSSLWILIVIGFLIVLGCIILVARRNRNKN